MRVLFRNQNNYQSAGDDAIMDANLRLLKKLVLFFVGGSVTKYLKHSSFTVTGSILILRLPNEAGSQTTLCLIYNSWFSPVILQFFPHREG